MTRETGFTLALLVALFAGWFATKAVSNLAATMHQVQDGGPSQ